MDLIVSVPEFTYLLYYFVYDRRWQMSPNITSKSLPLLSRIDLKLCLSKQC